MLLFMNKETERKTMFSMLFFDTESVLKLEGELLDLVQAARDSVCLYGTQCTGFETAHA